MKRTIALLLCILILIPALVSCTSIKPSDDDKGAEIPVYLSSAIYNLDPAYAYLDDAGAKILPMIYEGLFKLNSDGKAEKALCKSYTSYTDRDGSFVAEFTLNDTKWSDGRSVTANDFVFAWKRILEPEFSSKAASLLFDIKNARECKNGDVSIDDLGVAASETKVVSVTFTKQINIDEFIKTLASPALVPLREDKVNRLEDWASYYATMVTNGPFYVKIFIPGEDSMILERSIYYYRDIDKENQALDKYVKPFRLNITMGDAEKAKEAYDAQELVYNSEIAVSARADIGKNVKTLGEKSTHTYIFNTTKAPFNNADVRRALSLAIDRNELVNILTFAKAAEGVIPGGIFDTDGKKEFRSNGEKLIDAGANLDEAKKLVNGAKVTEKNITITIRDNNQTDEKAAEYVKGQWEQLGFKVDIKKLGFEYYTNIEYDQYRDLFRKAYSDRDFDVIAIDSQMYSFDSFSELASFARPFSGEGMDLSSGNFDAVAHISGYDNEEYDSLIESAFSEEDSAKKSELLHQAEKMLITDMPVIPLFENQNAYIKNKSLSKLNEDNFFGSVDFTKAKLSGYEKYKTE